MKRVVLALIAVLAVIAVPAAAQYNQQTPPPQPATESQPATETESTATTQSSPTTESSTGLTTSSPMPEERTNPVVATHSNDPGLTATGTVVSWNDDEVVLRTSIGMTHFKLLPNTVGSRSFTEGQALSIDFSRNEQGVLLAKQIRPADATAVESTAANVSEAVEEGVEETLQADVDNDGGIGTRGETSADTSSTLPATGSNSPLIALLGLAALGAAAGLRRL